MICDFSPTDETDDAGRVVYRCQNKGCNRSLRVSDPGRIRPCMCLAPECVHLGEPTDESAACGGCKNSPRLHAIWTCAVHGSCLPTVARSKATKPSVHKCQGCNERS